MGYGDKYPVTTAGRIIATFLMIAGIGMFGTLSGVAASIFLGDKQDAPASREAQQRMLERIETMHREIHALYAQQGINPRPVASAPPDPPDENPPARDPRPNSG